SSPVRSANEFQQKATFKKWLFVSQASACSSWLFKPISCTFLIFDKIRYNDAIFDCAMNP
ncbi:hypothetical protein, partial [Pasteurella multocida]|uniref:hypothetical protein n=1 Tax=Pasteurella multocida TaxID=747 RepID=UPI0005190A2C